MAHLKTIIARILADMFSSGAYKKSALWSLLIQKGVHHAGHIALWSMVTGVLAISFIVLTLYALYLLFQVLGLSPLLGVVILLMILMATMAWIYARIKSHLFNLKLLPAEYSHATADQDLLQKRIVLLMTAFLIGFKKKQKS